MMNKSTTPIVNPSFIINNPNQLEKIFIRYKKYLQKLAQQEYLDDACYTNSLEQLLNQRGCTCTDTQVSI